MKKVICSACGGNTKRNGKTASGTQRWLCLSCKASTTQKYDREIKLFKLFLNWLLSKKRQDEMGMPARTFRHLTARFWRLWPVSPVCDEVHHVVYVDGIWISGSIVILIACTDTHIIGWHLSRSECSFAWAALMQRIAPPDVVICDGGQGFEKARRGIWQKTRVQRCTFHAFNQVKRCTTTKPRLLAGTELYGIAKEILKVSNPNEAAVWMASFVSWCTRWENFLKEKTYVDGKRQYKHERLRKARRGLEKLVREGTLFTYLDEELKDAGVIPSTTNRIEGGVNRQLRALLNEHRGLSITRQIKAVFWWCYMNIENPMTPAQILSEMPTDESIARMYQLVQCQHENEKALEQWGTAVSWNDLHSSTPYRVDWD